MVTFMLPSKLQKAIRLDEERWNHVLKRPEMKNQINRIKETIINPGSVKKASTALLFGYSTNSTETPVTRKYLLACMLRKNPRITTISEA